MKVLDIKKAPKPVKWIVQVTTIIRDKIIATNGLQSFYNNQGPKMLITSFGKVY